MRREERETQEKRAALKETVEEEEEVYNELGTLKMYKDHESLKGVEDY